tara:strand:- start:1765 stop:4092 length:2328 start_codon:yes stop_codon:yes gene_type:complete
MHLGSEKIPQQKLPLSKKTQTWREACVESFIDMSNSSSSTRKDDLKSLYDYYNGVIEASDYKYVLSPYGKTRTNFPSKMRNYPIIKPIIDLLLGEKSKRPLNYTVSVLNDDAVSQKEKKKHDLLIKNLEKQFINKLQEQGMETGMGEQETQPPEDIIAMFDRSYTDNRAILGQQSLNYIIQSQEVSSKFQKAWFHYLISGEVYTHRGVRNKEPFYDVINPIDVDYDMDPDLEYVEDGDWALVRKYVHASTVIDHFSNLLSETQVLELEDPRQTEADNYLLYTRSSTSTDPNVHRNRLIEVVNVYWKSRKRVGFVSYTDMETGDTEEFEVEEGYKLPEDLKEVGGTLKWVWHNEVWKGTRIDGRMFIDISPVANQRTSLNNPSKCKLPINGRRYSDVNSKNISIVSLGIPYQLNYNIYKYRLELAIARSKDIVAQFDINMIPKKWDMDKFMYFVEGTGIAWVDYNKEGVQLSPQHQSVLDMSIKTIEQYIILLNSIVEEWEKLSGVNRQRQGQISQYEGKASSQQAIVQSSHITEDLFRKFEGLEQRDMQAMLDYSKEAWITGKNAMYMMPDGAAEYLSVDPLSHIEADYGIFVTNSGKEHEKIENIKGLAQSLVQNGLPASAMAEMFDAQSFPQLKSKLKEAEAQTQQLQQAQQQAEAQQAQQLQQMQQQAQEAIVDNENNNKELDRQNRIDIAMIQSEGANAAQDSNLQQSMKDFELKDAQVGLKAGDLEEKVRSNKAGEQLKRESQSQDVRDNTADRALKVKQMQQQKTKSKE